MNINLLGSPIPDSFIAEEHLEKQVMPPVNSQVVINESDIDSDAGQKRKASKEEEKKNE